jgi:P-type Na+/K+ transporter
VPVAKSADAVFPEETGIGDRLNVAYASTTVTKGRARGIVFATGKDTQIGLISKQLADASRSKRGFSAARKVTQASKTDDDDTVPSKLSIRESISYWTQAAWHPVGRFLGTNVGTPLQRRLGWLWIYLFLISLVFLFVVFAANNWSNEREVIIYAIATALSMLPASLPVVLTVTMAAGTAVMSARHVIVRKATALESLGMVTDICSDKTGTITQGSMLVERAWIPNLDSERSGTWIIKTDETANPEKGSLRFVSLPPSEMEQSPAGEASDDDDDPKTEYSEPIKPLPTPDTNEQFRRFLDIASLCNLAHVHKHVDHHTKEEEDTWIARGDPTEIAIQVFASRFNWNRSSLTSSTESARQDSSQHWTSVIEFPFDSDVKRMSVIFETSDGGMNEKRVFTKGAVERILDRCTRWYPPANISARNGSDIEQELSSGDRQYILKQMEALSHLGLRTLALASRQIRDEELTHDDEIGIVDAPSETMATLRSRVESNLVFYGLVGIYDPPRAESISAVKECHEAGIVVHMVSSTLSARQLTLILSQLTGDHLGTATAIAKQVGIITDSKMKTAGRDESNGLVMSADQFDALRDDEIDRLPSLPLVIARCAPSTKVRMIQALHRRNKFVAMVRISSVCSWANTFRLAMV